jgi:hypothetical protein
VSNAISESIFTEEFEELDSSALISSITPTINYVAEQFGNQLLFWTNIPDITQIWATLLAVGNWSYIYMANETIDLIGENTSISKCESIRDEFDSNIYPKAIEVAGHPDGNLGDIDGDPHVTILLAPYCRHFGDNSVLGYYDDKDDDPYNLYSNHREMFYVDSEHDLDDTYRIITHEFNHMIWGNYEYDEAEFLVEGLANYANDYSGYYWWVTDAVTKSFLNYPHKSLLYFVREYGPLWDASYGQAYLFVTYLADRFGNNFTRELVTIPEDGAPAVDEALSRFGYDLTFNDVYLDWIIACTIDETSFDEGIYGFSTVDYTINTHTAIGFTLPITKNDIKHYYYGFDVKRTYLDCDNFTFEIDNPYPYALGISIAVRDDFGWKVYKEIKRERGDKFSMSIDCVNIKEAYVITSLMSHSTPSEFGVVMSLDEIDSVDLSYTFLEWIITPTKSSFAYLPMLISLSVIAISYAVKLRKR